MSDFELSDFLPVPAPKCPLCGGATFLTRMHAAVAAVTNVFRCRICDVEFPVAKKGVDAAKKGTNGASR